MNTDPNHSPNIDPHRLFDRHIDPCREPIYRLYLRRGFTPQEAEDLTQETLVRAYRYFERIRVLNFACCYVRRIAECMLADYLKKKRRNPEVTGLNGYDSEDERNLFEETQLQPIFGPDEHNPEESLLRQEQVQSIHDALAELSERDRTILILHYLEGRSMQEIAEVLNMTLGNVKVAASRARERLRRVIERRNAE